MKNNDSEHNCQVFHFDLYGNRNAKYEFLRNHDLDSVEWTKLQPQEPQCFFVPKDFSAQDEYEKGFKVDELMKVNAVGVATGKDDVLINVSEEELLERIETCYNQDVDKGMVKKYFYRPFDCRNIYYNTALVQRARLNVMKHLIYCNLALLCTSKNRQLSTLYFSVSDGIADRHYLDSSSDSMNVFPLYLYPSDKESNERTPNLDKEIWNNTAKDGLHIRDARRIRTVRMVWTRTLGELP